MYKAIKLKWANKLMRAKYFVVLTDKESVIALNGVNPKSFNDILALQAQGAAITDFHAKLGELVAAHDKAATRLLGSKKPKAKAKRSGNVTTTNRNAKVKKIKVKE